MVAQMKFRLTVAGEEHPLEVLQRDGDQLRLSWHDTHFDVRILERGPSMLLLVDGSPLQVHAVDGRASCGGHEGALVDERDGGTKGRSHGATGRHVIAAPMPGRVVSVHCTVGQWVSANQPILVLEAMKMENELTAPCDGTIERILVGEGAAVEAGSTVVELVAGPAPEGEDR